MGKTVWITMIEKDEARAQAIYKMVSEYGLGVEGHFWKDDPENMEWAGAVPEIAKSQTGLWLIVGNAADFTKSVIQGLSLAALSVLAQKGAKIPTMILSADKEAVEKKLPRPLASAQVFSPDNPALGAKITAKANLPLKPAASEYRFGVYALPRLGLWLEAGPAGGTWQGVMFGVSGAAIDAMGVGPSGTIPDRCVLEYPMRDMELSIGDRPFTAWAARNTLSEKESVYVRVRGQPDAFVFGPFDPEVDALDVYTLPLEAS